MADQAANWRQFYERAWALRADHLRRLIAGGESNIPRLLRRFEAFERKYRIEGAGDGRVEWARMQWPKQMEMGPAGVPLIRPSSFRGEIALVPFHASDNLSNFLVDYIDEAGPFDAIIELGCGFGRNLFNIYYSGGPQNVPYYGGELTESGVALGQGIAALDPALKIEFFRFDYLDPVLDLPPFERALVFTMHSIEQVYEIDSRLFAVIAGAARRVDCIHFEPFGFQVQELGPATRAHRDLMVENNWNQNFAAALVQARDTFGLNISCLVPEMSLPLDPGNPTSLAIWHSGEKSAA